MTWFNNLPASIRQPLFALLLAVVAFFAAKYGITVPPAVNTETFIVADASDAPPLMAAVQAGDGPRLHPFIRSVARFKAAREYSRTHPDFTLPMALTLMRAIPDEAIIAEAHTQKVQFDPGVSGGKLSDWLDAHPDFFANLVKIFLLLAPLFA